MSFELYEAYQSIYEGRMGDAARKAAAQRLNALKNNPANSPYQPKQKEKDPWTSNPQDDKEFHRMNRDPETSKLEARKKLFARQNGNLKTEEVLVDFLVSEGYANSEESAEVMIEHMSDEWVDTVLSEMRKEDKVAGKESGGTKDPAMRSMKKVLRDMQGTPKGQQKKVPGKKPPVAGQYGARKTPAQIVADRRETRRQGERNMSSRFD